VLRVQYATIGSAFVRQVASASVSRASSASQAFVVSQFHSISCNKFKKKLVSFYFILFYVSFCDFRH